MSLTLRRRVRKSAQEQSFAIFLIVLSGVADRKVIHELPHWFMDSSLVLLFTVFLRPSLCSRLLFRLHALKVFSSLVSCYFLLPAQVHQPEIIYRAQSLANFQSAFRETSFAGQMLSVTAIDVSGSTFFS